MISFTVVIKKFGEQGEKTGWTYIEVPAEIAEKLKPGNKKSFRVKGYFDAYYFEKAALLPMGEGDFILPLKKEIRKAIGKNKGSKLNVRMQEDSEPPLLDADLIKCLEEEPEALSFFNTLSPGHRNYFSNWVRSARTEATRAVRIAHIIRAMIRKQDYGQMIRGIKQERKDLSG